MILLVDGNNIAYRAFFTPQGNLATKAGEPTGVMLGFLNSIKGYLERFPEASKVIVCWDKGRADWRKEVYPEYKASRSYGDSEEEKEKFKGLFSQIEILHDNLHLFGVNSIMLGGHEADDIIALVARSPKIEENVMVITADKDMLQLVDDKTFIYTPYKDKIISTLNFFEETKVEKSAYVGYRALVGDPSDNIKGVPGIGEKTAQNLMNKYGHIDNILGATGKDKEVLMKSARTKKIFEPENLKILGINNKIMNFDYVPMNELVNQEIEEALSLTYYVQDALIKKFFMRWQFVHNLAIYSSWINPFKQVKSK